MEIEGNDLKPKVNDGNLKKNESHGAKCEISVFLFLNLIFSCHLFISEKEKKGVIVEATFTCHEINISC